MSDDAFIARTPFPQNYSVSRVISAWVSVTAVTAPQALFSHATMRMPVRRCTGASWRALDGDSGVDITNFTGSLEKV